jgi:dTMP kinase
MDGALIAFEGLDQSGKQTQAETLRDRLKQAGRKARLVSFPDYGTSIGEEIARALAGEREYGPDVMQLLYVANRYERKDDLRRWLDGGLILVCDRYMASSVAYGEAFGLDAGWLVEMQRFLPPPTLTIMLDIAPETAAERKAVDRDRYERDLSLLARVRESYRRQAAEQGWLLPATARTRPGRFHGAEPPEGPPARACGGSAPGRSRPEAPRGARGRPPG